ncbi:MAG TPA: hypothetical protein V6D18_20820 [Thermosynechococcaceae cyanobacterium]
MNIPIAVLFDEADTHYLKPEELGQVNQYVQSLPDRLAVYRALRDQELEIVQWVADQLQVHHPQEPIEHLERSLKSALLVLRESGMAMLLDDPTYVQTHLLDWLSHAMSLYPTQAIDLTLHQLLNQRLSQKLDPAHWKRLAPLLIQAQTVLLQTPLA